MSRKWIYVINLVAAALATNYLKDNVQLWEWNGVITVAAFLGVCVILWLLSIFYNRRVFRQVPQIINLSLFFLKELVIANIRVTYEVLTPTDRLKPAVITVPLDIEGETEIMLLANMITLTPGTLSIDVSDDQGQLFVHTLYSGDQQEDFRKQIKEGFERKIMKVSNI